MIEKLGACYGDFLWKRFEKASRHPEVTQHRLLAALLRKNARTVFGRAHGFDSIDSPEAYRRNVPVRTFKDLREWTNRVEAGEPSILTREPVVFFNQSSGTSGNQKLIPVTQSWVRDTSRLRMI